MSRTPRQSCAIHRRSVTTLLCGVLLSACAARLPQSTAPADAAAPARASVPLLRIDPSASLFDGAGLLSSGLSVAGLDDRLRYQAGYQVRQDAMATPVPAATQRLGSQSWSQQLDLQLPSLYGAPLQLGARHQQLDSLLVAGDAQSQQQSMQLQWAPAFAGLQLSWTPQGAPVDTGQALQCDVAGQLRLPLQQGARFVAIDAGSRACRVVGADPRLAALDAYTWATALRWGGAQRETSLRLQSVSAATTMIAPELAAGAAGAGYELKLAQKRSLGAWQADAGLAWRRAPAASEAEAASPWAASAELSRRLALMSVAASWKRGDAYWFLPQLSDAADQLALSLDFSPWAATRWGSAGPTLAMSYNWTHLSAEAGRQGDQSINWNLAIPWR